jgi:hypothetical protein
MKINLINEHTHKTIGNIELGILPENKEKIIFDSNVYICINRIHSEEGIAIIVRLQEDYKIIW